MNIFVLDEDPVISAQMMCDKHVVKMVTETAQMLSVLPRLQGLNIGYKITHAKHPCTIWCNTSRENYSWLVEHGLALSKEYTFRYSKEHKAGDVIKDLAACQGLLRFKETGLTPFAMAMPDEFKGPCVFEAYRKYYILNKQYFARWAKGRPAPDWWVEAE